MLRLSNGFVAVLSIICVSSTPACKSDGDAPAATTSTAKPAAGDSAAAEAGVATAEAGAEAIIEPADADADAGAAAGEAEAVAEPGAEAGAADAGAADAGAVEEDPVPALFEQAKSLDTDDAAAQTALANAIAAGAAKLDAAKIANARGESLMIKGESERAEAFFVWARDAHSLYAEPVYNLAKLSAFAGDLEFAKEHLAELEKRGNKKLMKKVGVEPAFAPLHDDPDVRKMYEK